MLAVSAAVACGGDDGEEVADSGGEDFPTQADAICNEEGAGEAAQVYLELGYSEEDEDVIELRERVRTIRRMPWLSSRS